MIRLQRKGTSRAEWLPDQGVNGLKLAVANRMIEYAMDASAAGSGSVGAAESQRRRDSAQSQFGRDPRQPGPRLSGKLKRLLLSVSVVAIASVLTLVAGEVLVRFVAPTERLVPLNEVIMGITAQRPNVRGEHIVPETFDVSYTTNSQRFRSTKIFTSTPDPQVERVAVLGDSFTFGWGANDDQTYPSRLQSLLNNSLGPTEVINGGVCGTGTGNEVLWYDLWVDRFHPNVVILTVVPNDVDDDLARPLFSIDDSGNVRPKSVLQVEQFQSQTLAIRRLITRLPVYDYLTEHSELLNLFRRTVSVLIRRRHIRQSSEKEGPSAFDTIGLRLLAGEVEWLNQRVRSSGAQLIVVFVPFRESVYGQVPDTNKVVHDSLAMVGTLSRICEKDGIPFRDITSGMRTVAARRQQPLFYTSPGEAHPTPAGYQVIADLIAPSVIAEVHQSTQHSARLSGVK
jgi:lysophospholipase L1-like esterase